MFCLLDTATYHFVLVVLGYHMDQGYLEYSMQYDHFSLGFHLFTDHLKPIAYEVEDGMRYAVLLVGYCVSTENAGRTKLRL